MSLKLVVFHIVCKKSQLQKIWILFGSFSKYKIILSFQKLLQKLQMCSTEFIVEPITFQGHWRAFVKSVNPSFSSLLLLLLKFYSGKSFTNIVSLLLRFMSTFWDNFLWCLCILHHQDFSGQTNNSLSPFIHNWASSRRKKKHL